MANKVNHEQVRLPKTAFEKLQQDNPDMHFVKVEKESSAVPGYRSPYDDMIFGGYEVHTNDRAITGHGGYVVLKTSKKTFLETQAGYEKEARDALGNSNLPNQKTELGEAMSIGDLAEAAKNRAELAS